MKLALLSLDAQKEYKQAADYEPLLATAVAEGADLVLLPELSYGGYELDFGHLQRFSYDDASRLFSALACKYSVAIGFGAAAIDGKKLTNRYAVVSKGGKLLAKYDKIHIFSYGGEKAVFESGSRLSSFSLGGVNFGLSICYDLRFAEPFSLYSADCDVILTPSAWPKKRILHYKLLLKARALENGVDMVGINWQGRSKDGTEYVKSSFVARSDGSMQKPIFCAEEIDIFEIAKRDKSGVSSASDKKFELYAKLYADKAGRA